MYCRASGEYISRKGKDFTVWSETGRYTNNSSTWQ
jgi:hypothetical protein